MAAGTDRTLRRSRGFGGWLRKRACVAVVASAVVTSIAQPSLALTAAEVQSTIDKGKAFLYAQQKPDGQWETDRARKGNEHSWQTMQGATWGGYTAIATYALLASGERPTDPRLKKAIDFLKSADMIGAYAVGVRAQVWTFLPRSAETKRLGKRDADILLREMRRTGRTAGLWDYPTSRDLNRIDHSASQYGVLGLWACEQLDVEIPVATWKMIDAAWRRNQRPDGSWAYALNATDSPGGDFERRPPDASMTAAGVASLFITQDYATPQRVSCDGNVTNANIDAGIKWLADRLDTVNNSYAWYGVERIGLASGLERLGTKDWYTKGAENFVRTQRSNGSWDTGFLGRNDVADTAYALLFLTRGRSPVGIAKLNYAECVEGTDPAKVPWNQRARDVATIARWTGDQSERSINFEVVNLAQADDLVDAPVLYMAGSNRFTLTKQGIDSLRAYLDGGGLLLANADCASAEFVESVRQLSSTLYPVYEFRQLPATHPLLSHEQFNAAKWRNKPRLLSASNGVRELILVATDDPAKAWQARSEKARPEAFELGANVMQYAFDLTNLRNRLEAPDDAVKPAATMSAKLNVVQYLAGPNANPEPNAWARMSRILRGDGIELTVTHAKPGDGKLASAGLVHLTGTTTFTLDATATAELKAFVERGGTLLVDAAGGSGEFATAAMEQIAQVFGPRVGEALDKPLPPDAPVFKQPKFEVKAFAYRRYAQLKLAGALTTPRLRGASLTGNGPHNIFLSMEDLTAGMAGVMTDGVLGYSARSATEITRAIVKHAVDHRPK